jgi:hypothetical protein
MLLTLFIQQLENNAAGMEINVAVDLLLEIAVLTPVQTIATMQHVLKIPPRNVDGMMLKEGNFTSSQLVTHSSKMLMWKCS